MKEFYNFINERLNKTEWISFQSDSPIPDIIEHGSIEKLVNAVTDLLQAKPENLLFTVNTPGDSEDFGFFKMHILAKSEQVDDVTLRSIDQTTYLTKYKYNDKSFVIVEIRDPYEYSFIIINQNDFEFFDYGTDPNYILT